MTRKLKTPLATGILLSLAPEESSMIRTGVCVGVICLFRELPLTISRGYALGLCLMIFLSFYPSLVFERGFQLSLLGILGIWIMRDSFSTEQKVRAVVWLALWFVTPMALFFGKWVGDSFFVQGVMGFIWEQVLLPLLFFIGFIILLAPSWVLDPLLSGCETILTFWLNWEAIHTQKSGFSIYRPSELESFLCLGWLVALAYWNRRECQNVPKKNAYGATCIDLTRSASRQ